MATSIRYNTLVARVNQLENHLLPPIDPQGVYSAKDQDMIRSYCLLCHAEIEAYLEDFTTAIIDKAYNKWALNKNIISPIIFHLAFSFNGKPKELPYSKVVQSYQAVKNYIKGNNGIKENNLNGFFKPIGFDIDPTLKSILNDFGKTRGDIAHNSFQTLQLLDPTTEKANIHLILIGLHTFDEELSEYENSGVLNRTPVGTKWEKYNFIERCKILFKGRV